jgi:hypothetical protein
MPDELTGVSVAFDAETFQKDEAVSSCLAEMVPAMAREACDPCFSSRAHHPSTSRKGFQVLAVEDGSTFYWNLWFLCAFYRQKPAGRFQMEASSRQIGSTELSEPGVPGVSWAAVAAGAIASLALTLLLLSFGAGMGFAIVSPWGNSGVSATTFQIGTGLYFVVMAMISSALGGYLAGRLRSRWIGVRSDEVLFRDSAHGFLAWALASVLGAILLASSASSLIGGALSGATRATANSAQSSPMDGYIDALLRPDNPSSQGLQNPADGRAELVRLFTASFKNGNDLGAADRTYVAKVVSARTGLSQQDAEKRVNDVTTQIKADMDKARRVAMQIAIWLTLSLFIGAFSAALAATEGGGLRDGTWSTHPFRTASIKP